MGLFDFLKPKKSADAQPPETNKVADKKAPGSYNRRVKIKNVTLSNEDGTSRQQILSDIYHKKPPFTKQLDIMMQEFESDGAPAYRISVNGMCVGEAEDKMVGFISSSKDRLLGINAFKVNWFSHLDEKIDREIEEKGLDGDAEFDYDKYREKRIKEKDRIYYASIKISVRSKS